MGIVPGVVRSSEHVETVDSQPSWVINNDAVKASITQFGAMMVARFYCDTQGFIEPYYTSPWQNEKLTLEPPVLVPLRGDFFCLPFGGNSEAFDGQKFPPHGEPVSTIWNFESVEKDNAVTTLTLSMKTKIRTGRITRKIMLLDGQNTIYTQEVIEGFTGPSTLGHHAILAVPEKEGSIRIATSKFQLGMTSPLLFSNPVNREYQSFAIGKAFQDLRHVPLLWREPAEADCSAFPARTGFADVLGLFSEPAEKLDHGIAWTTATNQDGGYLWFSLKDPRVLPGTVFWIENHGRHAPPWNGRNRCLGLEDICGFFNEGMPASARPNLLNKQGIPTVLDFSPDRPTIVNYIQGVIKIPAGFTQVESLQFAPGKVTFTSADGQKVSANVNHEFLLSGSIWRSNQ